MATTAQDHRFEAVTRWLAGSAAGPVVVLCAEAPAEVARGRPAVRLEACVADTPAYRLVDLALAAGGSVVVSREGCTGASDTGALEALSRLVGTERLAVAASVEPGDAGPLVEVGRPPVARRGLFPGRRGSPEAAHEASDDQGRLVESLRRAGVADAAASAPGVTLTVTACHACGLCVRTCPHGALELSHQGNRSRLAHRPDLCRGEKVCVAVCPVLGVAAGGPLTWQDALAGERLLIEVASGPCRRCGARTTRPDGFCEPCALRRENPFGSSFRPAAPRSRS